MTPKLSHERFPLETLLRTREHYFQRVFAFEALDVLGEPPEGIAYEAGHDGLRIYASDEVTMVRAIDMIERRFPHNGEVAPPSVRFKMGRILEEPIMEVLVSVPGESLEQVQEELKHRGVERVDAGIVPGRFVLKGKGSLRRLMGFGARLAQITRGDAGLSMQLSHYSPLAREPDPEAA
ncbi:MAG TPA: hypothetical protein VJU83_11480 [Burkholderiales bacterium]|nr:hypothetical protein [Burkholderiales bacterium]